MTGRPAKIQISLGIRVFAQWVAKNQSFLHADSEDSDQTGQSESSLCAHLFFGFVMSRLILYP